MKDRFDLPHVLEPYREQLAKTMKPYINITTRKRKTNLRESKFGGNPYFPKELDYPKDLEGENMRLLAQINFSELPTFEGFPESGILQFFISPHDDVMGIDFDEMTNQSYFKVLYHEEIVQDDEKLLENVGNYKINEEFDFPIEYELSLSFDIEQEPISCEDYRVEDQLDATIDELQDEELHGEDLWEVYFEHFFGEGHKLGGYPYFTQNDPREGEKRYKDHEILLLQIDTEDDKGIMWGDAGVANFFIKKEDLEKRNFTNVLYNWDCH
ncbi:YwqG family protein [Pontibacillus salipaludis]|uniref:YwqG family protein n=1 Tax=Pontibacillus salipaludis TaxID=1697394 RepID=UPI0031E9EBB8